MRKILSVGCLIIALAACAPLSPENQSIDVDIYPIRYQMSLVVDDKHSARADEEWAKFYADFQTELLNKEVFITYSSGFGKTIAYRWRDELIEDGAVKQKLQLEYKPGLDNFDVVVEVIKRKVVTPMCQSQVATKYGNPPIGCATNSNLWQSMAYPEDGLLSTK